MRSGNKLRGKKNHEEEEETEVRRPPPLHQESQFESQQHRDTLKQPSTNDGEEKTFQGETRPSRVNQHRLCFLDVAIASNLTEANGKKKLSEAQSKLKTPDTSRFAPKPPFPQRYKKKKIEKANQEVLETFRKVEE